VDVGPGGPYKLAFRCIRSRVIIFRRPPVRLLCIDVEPVGGLRSAGSLGP
jgi:hypothetical protein